MGFGRNPPGRGYHGKKVLGLLAIVLSVGFTATVGLPQETSLSIHQRASACYDDHSSQFTDEPTNCDEVCARCHEWISPIEGQLHNSTGQFVDDAIPMGSETTSFDNWSNLPDLHKVCRSCHSEESEEKGNHPIFVEAFPEGDVEGLKSFDGQLLCVTCHNPHIEDLALLRIANVGSNLCQSCHPK